MSKMALMNELPSSFLPIRGYGFQGLGNKSFRSKAPLASGVSVPDSKPKISVPASVDDDSIGKIVVDSQVAKMNQEAVLAADREAEVDKTPIIPREYTEALSPAVTVSPAVNFNAAQAALARATEAAKVIGGCVDLRKIFGAPFFGTQCFPGKPGAGPRAEAARNQIKADEIEAGALEKMLEMANAPDANSEEKQQAVVAAADELSKDAQAMKDEQDADKAAAEARKVEISRLKGLHGNLRSYVDSLKTKPSGVVRKSPLSLGMGAD